MKTIVALISGLLFGAGLSLGGMTQVHVVKGFLDPFGSWDPRLAFVMGGAVLVFSFVYFLVVKKRSGPLLDEQFHLPENKSITPSLLIGSALFGLGWGWGGVCPGPGLTAAATFEGEFLVFVVSMIIGMWGFELYNKKV